MGLSLESGYVTRLPYKSNKKKALFMPSDYFSPLVTAHQLTQEQRRTLSPHIKNNLPLCPASPMCK